MVGDSDERVFRPFLEPVDRATGDQTREFKGTISKLFADWGEAEHYVDVCTGLADEEVVQVVDCGRTFRVGLFHSWDKFIDDLV